MFTIRVRKIGNGFGSICASLRPSKKLLNRQTQQVRARNFIFYTERSEFSELPMRYCIGIIQVNKQSPGFPSTSKRGRGRYPIIWSNFLEKCMKMKKVGSGAPPKFYYVDPPLVSSVLLIFHKLLFQYNTLRSAVEESLHPIVVFCIVFTRHLFSSKLEVETNCCDI